MNIEALFVNLFFTAIIIAPSIGGSLMFWGMITDDCDAWWSKVGALILGCSALIWIALFVIHFVKKVWEINPIASSVCFYGC